MYPSQTFLTPLTPAMACSRGFSRILIFESSSGTSSLDSVLGLLVNCFFEQTPTLDFFVLFSFD